MNRIVDWDKYPNFGKHEFDCKHTGKNEMTPEFMDKLQALRTELGFGFTISSGYRHHTHPTEARKNTTGMHVKGIACDIQATNGTAAGRIVEAALRHGFKGIGLAQDTRRNRADRFVHLDLRDSLYPVMWSY